MDRQTETTGTAESRIAFIYVLFGFATDPGWRGLPVRMYPFGIRARET
jgi:hypothetical protein